MWKPVWDDDRIAFANVMFLAALNLAPANFVRRDFLCVDRSSARHKRRRSFDDIDYIGIERVNFRLAWLSSAAGVNFVAACFKQRHSFGESSGNIFTIDECCRRW